jgi:hypothetical protein
MQIKYVSPQSTFPARLGDAEARSPRKGKGLRITAKNWNYYKTNDKQNLWDNPERTFSKKISAFYHGPEKYFNGKREWLTVLQSNIQVR